MLGITSCSFFVLGFFLMDSTFVELNTSRYLSENTYEGCCETQTSTLEIGAGRVFLPNIVTPNGDGINDIFFPLVSSRISSIENFSILDATLDTLIYHKERISFSLEESAQAPDGWDGKSATGQPHRGLFRYRMIIKDDSGISQFIQGRACSVLCDSAAATLLNNPSCLFPAQHDGNGGIDTTLPNYEEKCFSGN